MVIVIAAIKLPKVELKEDEQTGAWGYNKRIIKK